MTAPDNTKTDTIQIPDDSEYWEDISWDEVLKIECTINEREIELDIPQFFEEVNKNINPGQKHYLEVMNFDQESIIEILKGMYSLRTKEILKFFTFCYFNDLDDFCFYGDSKLGEMISDKGLEISEECGGNKDTCELMVILRGTVHDTDDYGDEEEYF